MRLPRMLLAKLSAVLRKAGLKVVAAKMLQLDDTLAGGFYAEHKERPFYNDLVEFMTSGRLLFRFLKVKMRSLKTAT